MLKHYSLPWFRFHDGHEWVSREIDTEWVAWYQQYLLLLGEPRPPFPGPDESLEESYMWDVATRDAFELVTARCSSLRFLMLGVDLTRLREFLVVGLGRENSGRMKDHGDGAIEGLET
jgi:hypothetical protein